MYLVTDGWDFPSCGLFFDNETCPIQWAHLRKRVYLEHLRARLRQGRIRLPRHAVGVRGVRRRGDRRQADVDVPPARAPGGVRDRPGHDHLSRREDRVRRVHDGRRPRRRHVREAAGQGGSVPPGDLGRVRAVQPAHRGRGAEARRVLGPPAQAGGGELAREDGGGHAGAAQRDGGERERSHRSDDLADEQDARRGRRREVRTGGRPDGRDDRAPRRPAVPRVPPAERHRHLELPGGDGDLPRGQRRDRSRASAHRLDRHQRRGAAHRREGDGLAEHRADDEGGRVDQQGGGDPRRERGQGRGGEAPSAGGDRAVAHQGPEAVGPAQGRHGQGARSRALGSSTTPSYGVGADMGSKDLVDAPFLFKCVYEFKRVN